MQGKCAALNHVPAAGLRGGVQVTADWPPTPTAHSQDWQMPLVTSASVTAAAGPATQALGLVPVNYAAYDALFDVFHFATATIKQDCGVQGRSSSALLLK
ncbi:unnamed protein product [Mesocestoides corti]|uniref:Uncharacterized protein n=1 Tax=Mesocestoides corti TaxID=53468 RepID=A0A0R3UGJ3_MESCO|nr:unnamed protein product [Mesocestoides corti]